MENADQSSNDNVFSMEINARGHKQVSHRGHISIKELKTKIEKNPSGICDFYAVDDINNPRIYKYLCSSIPEYPNPVEFHISKVTHVTNKNNLQKIYDSNGFKACVDNNDHFSWWSLNIDEESIKAAEELYLEKTFPERTEEQREKQVTFLSKFTTSPAFNLGKSRYGNFRFTLSLNEMMEAYRHQMCGGEDPVLREFKTRFFKQEIMYVVLIHSPMVNEKFKNYPEIKSSSFVEYKDDKIIWKAQAIGNCLEFQLLLNEEDKTAETEPVPRRFYVWDHVALAFDFNGVLHFPKEKLEESISYCEYVQISRK